MNRVNHAIAFCKVHNLVVRGHNRLRTDSCRGGNFPKDSQVGKHAHKPVRGSAAIEHWRNGVAAECGRAVHGLPRWVATGRKLHTFRCQSIKLSRPVPGESVPRPELVPRNAIVGRIATIGNLGSRQTLPRDIKQRPNSKSLVGTEEIHGELECKRVRDSDTSLAKIRPVRPEKNVISVRFST